MLLFTALKTYPILKALAYYARLSSIPRFMTNETSVHGKGAWKALRLFIVLLYFADFQLMVLCSRLASLVAYPSDIFVSAQL